MKKIELLSPAGSLANLKAAVSAGADSVYLGLSNFNARTFATNFSNEEFIEAMKICKTNNVKSYLTMNTLVKNHEIDDFFKTLKYAYEEGIDSVIIQDPSFIKIIRSNFPDLKIHISTQAGVLNSNHANLFSDVDRINLARELGKEQIKSIRKNCKKELEIFIHGALCVSLSGSCLFSSFVQCRSGNRGKCAQLCRKRYNNRYYLSTKELCLIKRLPEIISIGIDSIKIEGRMRTPYYVSTVTSIYRKAIDDYYNGNLKITDDIIQRLETAYTRGFTEGRFSSDKEMFNRQKSQGFSDVIRTSYNPESKPFKNTRKKINILLPQIPEKSSKEKQLIVKVYSKKDAISALKNGADIIIFDLFDKDFLAIKKLIETKILPGKLYASLPRIILDSDLPIIEEKIKENDPEGIFSGNLASIKLSDGRPIILDYNTNTFNDHALEYYHSLNCLPIISPELSIEEQSRFKNKNFISFVHGKIILMTLAHNFPEGNIQDDKGFQFRIIKIKNGSEIINSKELGLFNKSKNLLNSGIIRFFIDTTNDVENITKIYREILNGKTIDVTGIKNDYVLAWSNKPVL